MRIYSDRTVDQEYADVELTFSSYYKYAFYYKGTYDYHTIIMGVGGNSDDIYRHEVVNNDKTTLRATYHNFIRILDKDGVEVFTWYDY